jgi:hypothetical protein
VANYKLLQRKTVKRRSIKTPSSVHNDKAMKFDKDKQEFSFSVIRQERKKGLRM